ncbi:MAG TPA: DNA polymerase III subunit beta [Xanthomonadaceae bacterium]|nr:DNA polymerase III subunit beta [Xanthomonadaceae bacterium]
MRFSIQREALLRPLQHVVNVVEKRQTLPVLANLRVVVEGSEVAFTGSDMEVEMIASAEVQAAEDGDVTIPARKLFDLVRALPDGSLIELAQNGDRVGMKAGRSRFTLATLPASEYPSIDQLEVIDHLRIAEGVLKDLMDRTSFAMAQQDVRYYLNGLLFDVRDDALRCVATDGHRLAVAEGPLLMAADSGRQIILPRKGVMELQRLLEGGDGEVAIEIGRNHLRVRRDSVTLTSKLIDGRFPDYEAVIPISADKEVKVSREALRAALQRAAILSNEKYRGVKLEVSPGLLRIVAHNPEQEEAVEDVEAETSVDGLGVGFNVTYLLEAIAALRGEDVLVCLRDANSSCLLRDPGTAAFRHVIMPLRL